MHLCKCSLEEKRDLRNELIFLIFLGIMILRVSCEVSEARRSEQEACFARATRVWLAVNHNTSVTSG